MANIDQKSFKNFSHENFCEPHKKPLKLMLFDYEGCSKLDDEGLPSFCFHQTIHFER